jgi:hypothetical protein
LGDTILEKRRKGKNMSRTSDNDKKARDHQAAREEKNLLKEKNREAGKYQYSKKTDHL